MRKNKEITKNTTIFCMFIDYFIIICGYRTKRKVEEVWGVRRVGGLTKMGWVIIRGNKK